MCEKRRSLRKKVISSKKSCKSTIQEYNRVNRIVKREVKKAKRKQLDEKIMKLEDHFRNNKPRVRGPPPGHLGGKRFHFWLFWAILTPLTPWSSQTRIFPGSGISKSF